MRVCIVGCGAIGGLLASFLADADAEVTVLEQNEQFRRLREHGLELISNGGERRHIGNLSVFDDMRDCGTFDVVFLAVKAHEIAPLAADLPVLFEDHTSLVTLQNGIPWWYFQRHGGPLDGTVLKTVDPSGAIGKRIDPARIIGCVAYPAAEVISPGIVRHIEGVRFPLGELDGSVTERAAQVSELLTGAGLKSPILEDIRSEIWLKAWGNLAFNPISALTHATMAEIALDPGTREYTVQLMSEAQVVANELGVEFRVPLERRLKGAENVGGHNTSMLQDVLARRPIELQTILGAVIELAELVGAGVPGLQGLYALCSLRNAKNLQHTSDEPRDD